MSNSAPERKVLPASKYISMPTVAKPKALPAAADRKALPAAAAGPSQTGADPTGTSTAVARLDRSYRDNTESVYKLPSEAEDNEDDDDEDNIKRRFTNLRGEVSLALAFCGEDVIIPKAVMDNWGRACDIIQPAWGRGKLEPDEETRISEINQELCNSNPAYRFPVERLRGEIEGAREVLQKIKTVTQEEKLGITADLLRSQTQLQQDLDRMGISPMRIYPKDLRSSIQQLFETKNPVLKDLQHLLAKPTLQQRHILRPAVETTEKFFTDVLEEVNLDNARTELEKLDTVNKELQASNIKEELPKEDHTLPVRQLKTLINEYKGILSDGAPNDKGKSKAVNTEVARKSNAANGVKEEVSNINMGNIPENDLGPEKANKRESDVPMVEDTDSHTSSHHGHSYEDGESAISFPEPNWSASIAPDYALLAYKPAFMAVQSWWTRKVQKEDLQAIEEVNTVVEVQAEKHEAMLSGMHQFPASLLRRDIDGLRASYSDVMAANNDQETAQAVTKFASDTVGFRRHLQSYGISFKSVVPKALLEKLYKAMESFETPELTALQAELRKPTNLQIENMPVYKEIFGQYTFVLINEDVDGDGSAELDRIRRYDMIPAMNQRLCIPEDDHQFPIQQFKKLNKKDIFSNSGNKKEARKILDGLIQYLETNGFPSYYWEPLQHIRKRVEVDPDQEAHRTDQTKSSSEIPAPTSLNLDNDDDDDEGTMMIHPGMKDGTTQVGKVMFVRAAGYGYRVFLNTGTAKKPYLIVLTGSDFPRGFAKDWFENPKFKSESEQKKWKPSSFQSKDYIQTGSVVHKGKKAPPAYIYGVADGNPVIWTKSEFQARCGKKSAEREIETRCAIRERRAHKLEQARSQGVHPDTNVPLSPYDRQNTPWLFARGSNNASSGAPRPMAVGPQLTKIVSSGDDDDDDDMNDGAQEIKVEQLHNKMEQIKKEMQQAMGEWSKSQRA